MELKFVQCKNISYVSGYAVRKLWENHNKDQCETCYNETITNRENLSYNASLINEK